MNLEIREFSQAIINHMNKSTLPMEVKRLALMEILSQVSESSNEVIRAEIMERDRKEQEQKEMGQEGQEHGAEQDLQ